MAFLTALVILLFVIDALLVFADMLIIDSVLDAITVPVFRSSVDGE
jgi:hypothetical protein